MRVSAVVLLALLCGGCSFVSIRHCAVWNMLPLFGIALEEPACAGGQAPQPLLDWEQLKERVKP